MPKVIQQIKVSETKSLYIIDFNEETDELSFRTTDEYNYLQKEEIVFNEKTQMIHTNLYHFHIEYLKRFINDNKN